MQGERKSRSIKSTDKKGIEVTIACSQKQTTVQKYRHSWVRCGRTLKRINHVSSLKLRNPPPLDPALPQLPHVTSKGLRRRRRSNPIPQAQREGLLHRTRSPSHRQSPRRRKLDVRCHRTSVLRLAIRTQRLRPTSPLSAGNDANSHRKCEQQLCDGKYGTLDGAECYPRRLG